MSDERQDNEHGDEPRHGDAGRPHSEDTVEDFDLHMPEDLDIRRCYRHPDRETGVSCSNCGKPICYECMTPAPVGFRCPDCMAEQRGGLRAIPGGRAGTGGRVRAPQRPRVITRQETRARWQTGGLLGTRGNQATRVLVGMNIAVFILEMVTGGGAGLFGYVGGPLVRWGALYSPDVAVNHEYWRLFSAMFLHANLLHILFNMWALYIAGSYLEVLAGRTKYLLIYFISGFAGNILAYAIGPTNGSVVGASTAIFGLFGALFIYSVHNRNTVAGMALRSMGFVILINLFLTFTISGISWQGHVGGLLGGIAAIEALSLAGRKDLRDRIELPDGAAVAAIVAVLVLLTIWRTFTF
jgi:membrane associated rhomboid family serine protease